MSRARGRGRRAGKLRQGRKGGPMMTMLLLCLPLGLLFMPTALLMLVGLVPTAVAYVADRDPDKTAPLTVGAMNLVGVMPFAIGLWQRDHTLAGAMRVLGDPFSWLGMYGAAAVGWALYNGIPPMVAMWIAMRAEGRIQHLEEHQRDLVREWGPEVRGEREEQAAGL